MTKAVSVAAAVWVLPGLYLFAVGTNPTGVFAAGVGVVAAVLWLTRPVDP